MSAPAEPAATPVGRPGAGVEIHEKRAWSVSGWFGVLGAAACGFLVWYLLPSGWNVLPLIAGIVLLLALAVVPPGQTRVVLFFGRYVGTIRSSGFALATPLTTRRAVSIRVRNFETNHLKVNDADGNPVEIAAVVVWQVADTARAVFAVDDYSDFVRVQSESALRRVATTHPYDDPTGEGTSLRGSTDLVAGELADEVAQRVAVAGVQIVEVRVSHLAYASEIAQAMLRRQQASAVVAARSRIVEGAVGMVEMALQRLSERDIVDLDEERKAAMVSNLLVVLCGDQPPSPIVNAGSLYS
jgi:regulator of protease activity HflC (stomatin/prohibitin superfamily)